MYILIIYRYDETTKEDFVSEAVGPFGTDQEARDYSKRINESWHVMQVRAPLKVIA